ncbi:Uncharacterized protein SCF082_LOCUS40459 [Durusdinium trenchii]|uniref:Uncharacterized protein n=1 Tax=Durusdinium trenchii TaxID=1381693 RepID=A0ABP0QBS8_9DINO
MFLPLAVPATGVTQDNWGEQWLEEDNGHITTDPSDSSSEEKKLSPVVGHRLVDLPSDKRPERQERAMCLADSEAAFEQHCLRRLHFEASALVMAELKSKATDTTGDGTRKLPVAEKAARLKDQETRLPGVRIKGELQPSYALIDLFAQMKETSCVFWIPPSKLQ